MMGGGVASGGFPAATAWGAWERGSVVVASASFVASRLGVASRCFCRVGRGCRYSGAGECGCFRAVLEKEAVSSDSQRSLRAKWKGLAAESETLHSKCCPNVGTSFPQMASTLPTSDEQRPLLFEDLDVYFSQEECVSLHPAQKTLSRVENLDSIGEEDQTESSQELSLEPVELEELSLEKDSIAAPVVHYSEQSEQDDEILEDKMSGGTLTCKTKLISLLVTIDNQTPLVELSQCLGVKTLSDIIEVPWEEAKNVYKCPDCDQSFSDNTYLVLHQKIHLREKKYKCSTCEKTFSHRTNLRTHKRIHTGEKPYKCTECAASFRQQSHLSRHMNSHLKEKLYTCSVCGRGFMWLPGLAEHQKSHTDKKSYECADHNQETDLALPEERGSSDTPPQHTHCVKTLEQPSDPTLPEKDHKEDSKNCSIDDEDFFSFSRFKPLQCLDCDMTFPCFSELVSHQTIHDLEKPHKCKTCTKTFAFESELVSHEKSHRREEPFKCTVCGKSFSVSMQLVTHKRAHRRNSK